MAATSNTDSAATIDDDPIINGEPYGFDRFLELYDAGYFEALDKASYSGPSCFMSTVESLKGDPYQIDALSGELYIYADILPVMFPHATSRRVRSRYDHDKLDAKLSELEAIHEHLSHEEKEWTLAIDETLGMAKEMAQRKRKGRSIPTEKWAILVDGLELPEDKYVELYELVAATFDFALLHPLRAAHGSDRAHPLYRYEDRMASLSLENNELWLQCRGNMANTFNIYRIVNECTTVQQRNTFMPRGVGNRHRASTEAEGDAQANPTPTDNASTATPKRAFEAAPQSIIPPVVPDGMHAEVDMLAEIIKRTNLDMNDPAIEDEESRHETNPVKKTPKTRATSFSGKVAIPAPIVEAYCTVHGGEDYDCEAQGCFNSIQSHEDGNNGPLDHADLKGTFKHMPAAQRPPILSGINPLTPIPQTAPTTYVEPRDWLDEDEYTHPRTTTTPWSAPAATTVPWFGLLARQPDKSSDDSTNNSMDKGTDESTDKSTEKDVSRAALFGSTRRRQRTITGGIQPLALTDDLKKRLESYWPHRSGASRPHMPAPRYAFLSNARLPTSAVMTVESTAHRNADSGGQLEAKRWKGKGATTDIHVAKTQSTPEATYIEDLAIRPRTDTI